MAATSAPFVEKASAGMRDLWSAFSSSEARYFDEERYSEAEIRKMLSDSLTDRKIEAMKRILAAVSNGNDASKLFPDVVKNVSFQSLELKKLIYIYLVQYAENNRELALLSFNSFHTDLKDRSQLVRASALRAMASIKFIEVIQLVMNAFKTASTDNSPYVRKTAAQCMIKVYAVDPDQFFELRSLLLKLMNDHEVQVVGSAVMAFHQLCVVNPQRTPTEALSQGAGGEGGGGGGPVEPDAVVRIQLGLLHPHFRRLCQDVLLMDPWAQQSCIDVLLRYCRLFFACPDRKVVGGSGKGEEAVGKSEDLKAFLKSLKLLLSSNSRGVTLAAAVALCYLSPAEELGSVTMPLLRCLRQAPAESSQALLVSLLPIIEARPDLIRSSIREFFVQSFDYPGVKELKLKVLEGLVDETNVQMVLRELQAYVLWQSHPEFVARSVKSIAHIALKISSVTDSCLRGLVKMLDSKCEALACEAVVALRALLQRRRQSSDSGLGSVLPYLARYLEDLAAPTARASVVWIIGQYQQEAPKLAPDVMRRLAKTFATERQEVKQQTLMLSLKVWAFHALNAVGKAPAGKEVEGKPSPGLAPDVSAAVLPRLEAVVDHIMNLAFYDVAWDVRDTARTLKQLKAAAKAQLAGSIDGSDTGGSSLGDLGLWYCQACINGESPGDDAGIVDNGPSTGAGEESTANVKFESEWKLGSLAQALDFPLDTYRPVPAWAEEGTPDEIRNPVKAEAPSAHSAPKSISSSNVGNVQHMEQRVQNPSNIGSAPVVSSLEDLDLFYSQAASGPARAPVPVPEPAPTLEQVRLNAPVVPVGTAVYGEDDESEEEEEEPDEGDHWKYCVQAPGAAEPAPPKAAEPAPPSVPAAPAAPPQEAPAAAEPAPKAAEPAPASVPAAPAAPEEASPAAAPPEPSPEPAAPADEAPAAEQPSPTPPAPAEEASPQAAAASPPDDLL